MIVILKPDVQNTLTEISDFVDSINMKGAGERWVDRLLDFIDSFSSSSANVTYAPCRNAELASAGLSCFNYNDWIVAFKIEDNEFVVYQIVRGSILF